MELWDTILTVCRRILSYLLWYSTMVSVGRSVRSYVCAELLSTSEGSPSKEGYILTPPGSATDCIPCLTLALTLALTFNLDYVIAIKVPVLRMLAIRLYTVVHVLCFPRPKGIKASCTLVHGDLKASPQDNNEDATTSYDSSSCCVWMYVWHTCWKESCSLK